MAKLDRDRVVAEALAMLAEAGLAGISTRGLARRLCVEQPALYWHFPSKAALLAAMAAAAMRPHAERPLPSPSDDWHDWFGTNARSFRTTLLLHRDGALLHAGSRPQDDEAWRIEAKVAFLVSAGIGQQEAVMALLAASRFTLGCALEEQADQAFAGPTVRTATLPGTHRPVPDHHAAFEAGLRLLVRGLDNTRTNSRRPAGRSR